MNPLHRTGYHHHTLPSGFNMAYRDLGEGQPVVMVHGNPTWSYYYRHLVQALLEDSESDFRTLVPDHIGMGHSDRWSDPDTRYSLQQRIDDFDHWVSARLDEQVEKGGPSTIDLVVHDWGGAIGLSWAARHPEKIRRLVILNTWAFNIPKGESLPWALKIARSWVGQQLIVRLNAFAQIAAKTAAKKPVDADTRAAWLEPYEGEPTRRLATAEFVRDIPLSPSDPAWSVLAETEDRLRTLKDKPIFIGWGMQDFVFTPQVLEIWATHFSNARVERFDDALHYVLEDAGEVLIPQVVEFLGAGG